ncbi:reticuline oxidase [Amborella trichopoda]|uniref:FAD-binding PCMH-type domain-containing protein n=1 Tax=Amborella trichopoda TaxID=13333 RepID=W1PDZ1_AMBTC|nr:reticuline oxidase [Amborella trichopoda]ERN08152.1 hypothetical protein AMTR_s00018p00124850 [Amborella trichopoda]|eukprot:XP_006846477.1 reticuline oxidase [Amborella trichopoda]
MSSPKIFSLYTLISLLGFALGEDLQSCLLSNGVLNFTSRSQSSDAAYNHFLSFSIQNLRFTKPTMEKPVMVILPETHAQLSSTILCSKETSHEIRIRCGGHSYEGLSSTGDRSFIIIDLMNLNNIHVDLETQTAWVEAGATLGETYYSIARATSDFGFSAGSCPTVGSGGHISGGGFGFLSRKYGLAADNVLDTLVINSGGEVMEREAMGEDMFWALRGGGGGNWGLVYAWKIRLLEVPKVVTVFTVSREKSRESVLELVHKWQYVGPKLEDDFYLSVFVGAGLPQARKEGISATFKGMYLGNVTYALYLINGVFPELEIEYDECLEMSWIESIVFFSGLKEGSTFENLKDRFLHDKNYFKAKSDYVRTPIPKIGLEKVLRILEEEPKGYVILDPYGGKMARIPWDSIPFPHRANTLYAIQYLVAWNKEDNSKADGYIHWLRGFYQYMTPFVSQAPRAAYVNYVDLDLGTMDMNSTDGLVQEARAWGEKYFLGNYDRLVRVKQQCDPDNVFSNPQGIPPIGALAAM